MKAVFRWFGTGPGFAYGALTLCVLGGVLGGVVKMLIDRCYAFKPGPVGSYLVCWWLVIFGMLVALVCDLHVPEFKLYNQGANGRC